MSRKTIVICGLILGVTALCVGGAYVYEEQEGLVVIEAEAAVEEEPWQRDFIIAGSTGQAYYRNTKQCKRGGEGVLTYLFKINKPGDYEVVVRSYFEEKEDEAAEGKFFLRLPTGEPLEGERSIRHWTACTSLRAGEWSWETWVDAEEERRARAYLRAGEHRLQLSACSDGQAIDRVVVYNLYELELDEEDFTEAGVSPHRAAEGTRHQKKKRSFKRQ